MGAAKISDLDEVRISIKVRRDLRAAMQRTAKAQERSMAGWARTVLRNAAVAAERAGLPTLGLAANAGLQQGSAETQATLGKS